jgi:predicted HTH domain antitoxin
MNRLVIDCPDELLLAVGTNWASFEQEAKFALAAKLYELGRLSSGRAAQLAGVDRVSFLLGLHRVGVAALDLDDEEFEHDAQRGLRPL